jgi:hypothetical protein
MTNVHFQHGEYKGWQALWLSRGPLELAVVPQVGGRIMGLRWHGRELFFTQPEREGRVEPVESVTDLHSHKREMGFPLWGGDKTWIGPQDRWTDGVPFLDLDSGSYEMTVETDAGEVTVRLRSPVCRETGVQIERRLSLPGVGHNWVVTHSLHNHAEQPVEWALWDVAMVLRPGRVYLPRHPESRFTDGVKNFDNEGQVCPSPQDCALSELGRLAVVTCESQRAFKVGVDATEGWMLGVLEPAPNHKVGYLKRFAVEPGLPYPHGCVAEVYNSDRYPYLEMEILAPLARLEPGAVQTLEETQSVFDLPDWPRSVAEVEDLVGDL